MKHIFIALSLSISLFASNYPFLHYHTNYQTALKQAQKEHKMVMLFITQDFCPWCKRLAQKILSDAKIKKVITKNFVPLLLNKDRDNIPTPYETHVSPTLFFINAQNDEEVWRQSGYCEQTKLLQVFKQALKSLKEDLEDEED